MTPYFPAVDIFLENELGEILLLKRAAQKKVLPNVYNGIGGRLETNETLLQGLLRECREEIGTDAVTDIELKAILTVHDDFGDWLIFGYHGLIQKSLVTTGPMSEGVLEWVPKKKVPAKELVPDLFQWYEKLFSPGLTYGLIEYDENYGLKKITLQ